MAHTKAFEIDAERPACGDAVGRAARVVAEHEQLAFPGHGATLERWHALAEVAAADLSVARLVEGHHDAVAILAELGRAEVPTAGLLGVWAARPAELFATRRPDGWVLDGTKPFCSGSTRLAAALVTATSDDGPRLFFVDADRATAVPGSWSPLGMAATLSDTVSFDHVVVEASAAIGGPGAYVDRPGFGHGGCGVAACWWGGARALLADVAATIAGRDDDLTLAAYGHTSLAVDSCAHVLRAAAAEIDAAPNDVDVALRCAAVTRTAAAEAARTVLSMAERHLGTSVLGTDCAVAGRLTDLATYLTQHRDQAAVDLGRRLLRAPAPPLC